MSSTFCMTMEDMPSTSSISYLFLLLWASDLNNVLNSTNLSSKILSHLDWSMKASVGRVSSVMRLNWEGRVPELCCNSSTAACRSGNWLGPSSFGCMLLPPTPWLHRPVALWLPPVLMLPHPSVVWVGISSPPRMVSRGLVNRPWMSVDCWPGTG